MSVPFILPLDSPQATLQNAGGKGANLARLTRSGLHVPGGFIITTEAYRAHVAANGLADWLLATIHALRPDDGAALEAVAAAIRARFAAANLSPALAETLCAAYTALDLSSVAVAVRSSATAEDLPDLSFAGQQDTFLNVVGEEGLLRAVVDCWSSLWTPRAIGYRARNDIPPDGLALAVVVQTMVQSEASGVLFTANPLTGRRDETVIDATLGLGEALVSGRVEPDHYVVDGGQITAKRLGAKALAIHGQTGGGTVTQEAAAAARQALPDAAIVQLASLGARVEDLFGDPQDIEWAWAEDHLWLLQARPITSLYPLPADADPTALPLHVWVSFGAIQGMLDPITPLGQEMLRGLIAQVANLFGGHARLETQQTVVKAGERFFVNLTGALRYDTTRALVRAATGIIEPSIRKALMGVLSDPKITPADHPNGRHMSRFTLLRHALPVLPPAIGRLIATLLRPEMMREQTLAQIDGIVAEFTTRSQRSSALGDQLALIEAFWAIGPRLLFQRLIPAFASGMAALTQVRRLAGELPDEPDAGLELTRGLPHNVTTEMDLVLWAVAQAIRNDPASAAWFGLAGAKAHDAGDVAELTADYTAGRLPAAAQAAVAGFMARYGMRGVGEIDLGRPRWRDNPLPVIQSIRSYLTITDAAAAPDAVFRRGAEQAAAAAERLTRKLRRTHGGWRKAAQFRWAVRRLRALAGLRESPKFMLIRLFGIVQSGLLANGRALAAAGVLAQPEDIFFLQWAELRALADGAAPQSPTLAERVAARRQVYDREMRRRQIPRVMLSDGRAFYEGAGETAESGENVITGAAVSPGVAEGRVCVVLDPHTAHLSPGDILVCPGTDPAWTPLFLTAGGLITEVGGLMTHGSVVAREYGIPAVVGVGGATTRLHTGQRIRIDGSAGQITILSDAP
jgi:rifampicin phosphotransferase